MVQQVFRSRQQKQQELSSLKGRQQSANKKRHKPCDSKLNEVMETSSATWHQQIFGNKSSRATNERLRHERACSAYTLQLAISHAKDATPNLATACKKKKKPDCWPLQSTAQRHKKGLITATKGWRNHHCMSFKTMKQDEIENSECCRD